jgi:hypothetical protein
MTSKAKKSMKGASFESFNRRRNWLGTQLVFRRCSDRIKKQEEMEWMRHEQRWRQHGDKWKLYDTEVFTFLPTSQLFLQGEIHFSGYSCVITYRKIPIILLSLICSTGDLRIPLSHSQTSLFRRCEEQDCQEFITRSGFENIRLRSNHECCTISTSPTEALCLNHP